MRQLLPVPAEIDPFVAHAEAHRPSPAGRPWVALNMIVSVDGAIAVDGRSGGLASEADKAVFRALRSAADVILVGAGTARAEGYGPPRTSAEQQEARLARGQARFPRIAVVTASAQLDPTTALFTEAPEPVLVLTAHDAPAERLGALAAVAEVRPLGPGSVDAGRALAELHALGARFVLCEGGPALNGHLLSAGLVDEVDVSISPLLVGGDGPGFSDGPVFGPTPLALAHLWEADGMLLARYVRGS